MKLNGQKIFFYKNRPFIKRLVIGHYSSGGNYVRRVYGYIKDCQVCNKKFFTQNKTTRFCSDKCPKIGKGNPMWKGGRYNSGGYVMLRIDGRLIKEHRYVMEKSLGRPLKTHELVHHKNAVKTDNRLENLEIILQYPKTGLHRGVITCPHCSKEFSIK